jgi:elongation factor 1-gamma
MFKVYNNDWYILQDTEKAKEQLQKALGVLNGYLQTRTYLVGERITQADITVACDLLLAYQYVSSHNDVVVMDRKL